MSIGKEQLREMLLSGVSPQSQEIVLNVGREQLQEMLRTEEFPLSAKYDPVWVLANEMGPNALCLTEWLCRAMAFKPAQRVLDMGCGRAMSSVFLAKELGVQVWALDLWIDPTENWRRIRQAGLADRIFPLRAEAHALPFAEGFFDAVVSVDSYHYYGTDDLYLRYFLRFLKPGGQIGIVVPGLMHDLDGPVPEHLTRRTASGGRFWDPGECFSFHTVEWWRRHWEQTELVEIELADTLTDGWRHWLQFERAKMIAGTCRHDDEVPGLEADQGRYLGLIRMIGRRKEPQP